MVNFTNLFNTIHSLYTDYDEQWSELLYRAGNHGIFYHTCERGAGFYGKPEAYECPINAKGVILDLDEDYDWVSSLDNNSDDFALIIEDEVIPYLRKLGYDCIIINGETGREVAGVPIEVVLFSTPQKIINSIADNMNDN